MTDSGREIRYSKDKPGIANLLEILAVARGTSIEQLEREFEGAGYGDFTARTNLGHTLSVSEALLGQIYLVTVVSLIVANLGRSRPAANKAE